MRQSGTSPWNSICSPLAQQDENASAPIWNPYPVTSLPCDPGQLIVPLYTSVFPLVKWNNNTYCRYLEKLNEWEIHVHIKVHTKFR